MLLLLLMYMVLVAPHVVAILASRTGDSRLHRYAVWCGIVGLLALTILPASLAIVGSGLIVATFEHPAGRMAIACSTVLAFTTLACITLAAMLLKRASIATASHTGGLRDSP